MAEGKRAAVLDVLLEDHPELRAEAEAIAARVVSSPSVDQIADEILDTVESVDMDALNGRAGRHSWGYVEPSEAAWELPEEALDESVQDMKHLTAAGLDSAAETLCCGIVVGLLRAKDVESDGALNWAPDFPLEEACHAVSELIRTSPAEERTAVCLRLLETLNDLAPAWHGAISRAANSALLGGCS